MLDSSIPLQARAPQIAAPMESAVNALALQGGIQKNKLATMQMGKLERDMADEEAVRGIMRAPGMTLEKAPNALLQGGFHKPALEIQGKLLEQRAKLATIGKDEAATNLQHLGVISSAFAGLGENPTQEAVLGALNMAKAAGVPEKLVQQLAQGAPQNSMTLPAYAKNVATLTKQGIDAMKARQSDFKDIGGSLVDTNPFSPNYGKAIQKTMTPGEVATDTRTREEGAANRGVTIRGQDISASTTRRGQNMTDALGRDRLALDRQTATAKPTAGQEATDREFAKEYSSYIAAGGYADTVKQLSQLKDVSKALDKDDTLTGPIRGSVHENIRALTNPAAVKAQNAVEEVVQRNLRLVLGAQFTEKEGERLIARAYNPRLGTKENKKRVDRLITQMEAAAKSKKDAAEYFEKNGTLRGWQGKLYTIADFDPEAGSSGAPAGGGWKIEREK